MTMAIIITAMQEIKLKDKKTANRPISIKPGLFRVIT